MAEPKSVLDEDIPDLQYVYPKAWGPYNPIVEMSRWRFLKTCKRLGIPHHLWSDVQFHAIPGTEAAIYQWHPFDLPPFNITIDTESAWKQRAQAKFKEACDELLAWTRSEIKKKLEAGHIQRVKPTRQGGGNAPIELRYEWAAKRYCLDTDYKDLATSAYNADRVKQAVAQIFAEADITPPRTVK